MKAILEWLVTAEDPRRQSKVKHLMKDIIAIMVFAELSNASEWIEIYLFAQTNEVSLRKYLALPNGWTGTEDGRRPSPLGRGGEIVMSRLDLVRLRCGLEEEGPSIKSSGDDPSMSSVLLPHPAYCHSHPSRL